MSGTSSLGQLRSAAQKSHAPAPAGLLQRQCACGGHVLGGGECTQCAAKRALLQRRAAGAEGRGEVPSSVDDALRSTGTPLDAATRTAMENRFAQAIGLVPAYGTPPLLLPRQGAGRRMDEYEQQADAVAERVTSGADSRGVAGGSAVDFSDVRVHTDADAARATDAVGALAFTAGPHLVFGEGQYAPRSAAGSLLLAHELTHVLQQRGMDRVAVQCACRPPRGYTFGSSPIAAQIRRELAKPQFMLPPAQAGAQPVSRFAPDAVIAILASSNCFLRDAQSIESQYYTREGQPRRGAAPLQIHLHEEAQIGSYFAREATAHRVEVQVEAGTGTAALQALVRRIVHEIVHVTHPPVAAGAARGPVTGAEQAGIAEEAQARARENEIMAEIAGAQGWTLTPTPATPAEVRESLRTGWPQLTYQEYFIIEEMKRRKRVPNLDEQQAVLAARRMIGSGGVGYVSPAAAGTFTINRAALSRHRQTAGNRPVEPLGIDDAMTCANLFDRPRLPPGVSPGCQELLRILRGWSPLPGERVARHRELLRVLEAWQTQRFEPMSRAYNASSVFIGWYDGLPQAVQSHRNTLEFFQWVLIAESMSAEWQAVGRVDREVRRRHFEFLRAIMGRALLHGVPAPAAAQPARRTR